MLTELVSQWDARKSELEEWLRENHPDSYENLVEELVRRVLIEPLSRGGSIHPKRIVVVDHGDYQGTQLFFLALYGYQPGAYQYLWFDNNYGSCSGCDTLQAIGNYDSDPPTNEQISEYMALALHMVQRMKWLVEER
jgi:hypothetical protein